MGYRLALSPDGLSLSGPGEPSKQVLEVIRQHKEEVVAWLESEAAAWTTHEASIAAGRVTKLSPRVVDLLASRGATGPVDLKIDAQEQL